MYDDLSHRLYRHLVRVLERDPNHGDPERARQVLLAACEATVLRLVTDHGYFVRPQRFLFEAICALYPLTTQLEVWRIVERDVALAAAAIDRSPAPGRQPELELA